MDKLYIGSHVSAAGGVQNAPFNAKAIGANAFALFTGNPRGYSNPSLSKETIAQFKTNMQEAGIKPEMVLPHDSYLINMASPKEEIMGKSFNAFLEEVERVEALGLTMLNFHPGSPSETDPKAAMKRLASYLKQALAQSQTVTLVLEATAGQGNHLGRSFEELAFIIEEVGNSERVGVCIDTCHIFAAGYDIRTAESFAQTMATYDRILGRKSLKAMHLNDSMKDLSCRVDRHSPLGEGFIGLEAFKYIANDSYMQTIPLILETPVPEKWPEEIAMMRSFVPS